jgi:hypothetical protein
VLVYEPVEPSDAAVADETDADTDAHEGADK